MNDLTLICGKCRKPVAGDTGFLGVSFRDIREHQSDERAWAERNPGDTHSLADLLSLPEDVHWYVRHYPCQDGDGSDCYQIDADRIATWAALARWTSDLMAKNWLPLTDWDVLLREVADGTGDRIRVTAVEAA